MKLPCPRATYWHCSVQSSVCGVCEYKVGPNLVFEMRLIAGTSAAPSTARQDHAHVLVMLLLVMEIGVSLLKYYSEAKERSPMDRPSLHLPRTVTLPPPAYLLIIFPFSRQEILSTQMLVVRMA